MVRSMGSNINLFPTIEDLKLEDPDFVLYYNRSMTNDLCLSTLRDCIFKKYPNNKLVFPELRLVYSDPGYNLAYRNNRKTEYLFPDHNELAKKIIYDYGLSKVYPSHFAKYTDYQGNSITTCVNVLDLLNSYLVKLGFNLIHQWSKENIITCWINDDEEIEVSYFDNTISLSTPNQDADTWKDIVYLNHSWYRGDRGIEYISETMPKARNFIKKYPM
jgi:hypothetical protein